MRRPPEHTFDFFSARRRSGPIAQYRNNARHTFLPHTPACILNQGGTCPCPRVPTREAPPVTCHPSGKTFSIGIGAMYLVDAFGYSEFHCTTRTSACLPDSRARGRPQLWYYLSIPQRPVLWRSWRPIGYSILRWNERSRNNTNALEIPQTQPKPTRAHDLRSSALARPRVRAPSSESAKAAALAQGALVSRAHTTAPEAHTSQKRTPSPIAPTEPKQKTGTKANDNEKPK